MLATILINTPVFEGKNLHIALNLVLTKGRYLAHQNHHRNGRICRQLRTLPTRVEGDAC